MILTDEEKLQIERIKNKINLIKIEVRDYAFKIPKGDDYRYTYILKDIKDLLDFKLKKPASESVLLAFEKKYDIVLPRDYRIFLGFIANGAPFVYRIYSLKEVDYYITDYDPKEENIHLDELDESGNAFFEDYNGILTIGGATDDGCSGAFNNFLVVAGDYYGRRLTIGEAEYSFMNVDESFLDMYERWLDDFIIILSIMKNFADSNTINPSELREYLANKGWELPKLDKETIKIWKDDYLMIMNCLHIETFIPGFCLIMEHYIFPIEKRINIREGFIKILKK